MLFWALLASGQINMRKVDGSQTLAKNPAIRRLTWLLEEITSSDRRSRHTESQHNARRHLLQRQYVQLYLPRNKFVRSAPNDKTDTIRPGREIAEARYHDGKTFLSVHPTDLSKSELSHCL